MNPPWMEGKLIHPSNLVEKREQLRKSAHSIATLNGSFDLLHAGHLKIIYEASTQADTLIVALNTDQSIKGYKGPNRPIISLEGRLQMVAALSFVDFVTYFEEDDPRDLLKKIQPDVHVNGSEHGHQCIEADVVTSYGGTVHIVDLIPLLSTSQIIKRIKLCV